MSPGLSALGGRVPAQDDEIARLWAMLQAEEWLQGASERAGLPGGLSDAVWGHVELYALLAANEKAAGASDTALRLAWLLGAGAALAAVRCRNGGPVD